MKLFAIFAAFAAANQLDIITPEDVDNAFSITNRLRQLTEKFDDDYDFPCLIQFFQGCKYCVEEVGDKSQFCVEENPNYNPIVCTIQMNKCFLDMLDGVMECQHQP